MAEFDYTSPVTIPTYLVEVVPGEPFEYTLPVLDEDGAAQEIVDASAWSARGQVRAEWSSSDVLYTFDTEADPATAEVTEGAAGSLTLTATAAATASWQTEFLRHVSSPPRVRCHVWATVAATPRCLADLTIELLPNTTRED